MGCDFFMRGKLPDENLQEKVIGFVRTYYTREPDLVVVPQAAARFRTLISEHLEDRVVGDYPFNFFGIVPTCRDRLIAHGQFVFDRNDHGRLVRFEKLPESLCRPEEDSGYGWARYARERIDVHIRTGGYDREINGWSLAVVMTVIKLRWWPDLWVGDDYNVCEEVEHVIAIGELPAELRDESLDVVACLERVGAVYDRLYPPPPPPPPVEPPVKADLDTLNWVIAEQELGVRTLSILKRAGVKTIRDLLKYSEQELLALPNFGRKSLYELREFLEPLGMALRENP